MGADSKWKAFSNTQEPQTVPGVSSVAIGRPGDIISALAMFNDKELTPRLDNIVRTLEKKEKSPETQTRIEALQQAQQCSSALSQATTAFFAEKQQHATQGIRNALKPGDASEKAATPRTPTAR